jgi:hypothetical protein
MEKKRLPWYSVTLSRVFRLLGLILLIGLSAGLGYLVFEHWLTPRERKAAIPALYEIQKVRGWASSTDVTYQSEAAKAEQVVNNAQSAAVSDEDRWIAAQLAADLEMARYEKEFSRQGSATDRWVANFTKASGDDIDNRLQKILGTKNGNR